MWSKTTYNLIITIVRGHEHTHANTIGFHAFQTRSLLTQNSMKRGTVFPKITDIYNIERFVLLYTSVFIVFFCQKIIYFQQAFGRGDKSFFCHLKYQLFAGFYVSGFFFFTKSRHFASKLFRVNWSFVNRFKVRILEGLTLIFLYKLQLY